MYVRVHLRRVQLEILQKVTNVHAMCKINFIQNLFIKYHTIHTILGII